MGCFSLLDVASLTRCSSDFQRQTLGGAIVPGNRELARSRVTTLQSALLALFSVER